MESAQIKELLIQLREEHQTLSNAIVALEQYLAVREKTPSAKAKEILRPEQVQMPGIKEIGKTVPKGSISIRQAIVEVLKQAKRPMRAAEIWEHAYARGARTTAKRPDAIVALSAGAIDGIEKVGPRTFVWFEYKDGQRQQ